MQVRDVRGEFFRHAAPGRDAFAGGLRGRWGADIPVIYLARPAEGSVIEAYRHLVDDSGVPAHHVGRRILYSVAVEAACVLDLTDTRTARAAGLSAADLCSAVGDYVRCQRVGATAHEHGLHGILAPAPEGGGETLALFPTRLAPRERPRVLTEAVWQHLPPDPRQARTDTRPVDLSRSRGRGSR